jgi:DNA invertase Pin-like site-specific DNA recombinase
VKEAAMKTAIAYIRVSTQKQGKSGLGLEAQQALIQRFADQEGIQIVQTFTEVQSGKDEGTSSQATDRPAIDCRASSVLKEGWAAVHRH